MMKKLLLALFAVFAFSTAAMAAVDLNTATRDELQAVKGIGPAKADAIVEYRTKNGPFKSVDDLKNVKGFGEKSVAQMRADLTAGAAAPAKADKQDKADKKGKKNKDAKQ